MQVLTADVSVARGAFLVTSVGGKERCPLVCVAGSESNPEHISTASGLRMVATPPEKVVEAADSEADPLGAYVKDRGGDRVIRKILIANNGMAATKSILSMRQWAYMELGDEKAIKFVAMATPEDLNANAEFIRLGECTVLVLEEKVAGLSMPLK